tara:strand:+ start:128 stop:823 length:696 start_codon:yes stop_codon:yes gene_type:complete
MKILILFSLTLFAIQSIAKENPVSQCVKDQAMKLIENGMLGTDALETSDIYCNLQKINSLKEDFQEFLKEQQQIVEEKAETYICFSSIFKDDKIEVWSPTHTFRRNPNNSQAFSKAYYAPHKAFSKPEDEWVVSSETDVIIVLARTYDFITPDTPISDKEILTETVVISKRTLYFRETYFYQLEPRLNLLNEFDYLQSASGVSGFCKVHLNKDIDYKFEKLGLDQKIIKNH